MIIIDNKAQINYFLVSVFNEILRIEENSLQRSEFKNLSVREMHVIEAVCNAASNGEKNRASDIALALHISAGTLTTEVSVLEKKGCLVRKQDHNDKRIVRIYATEKGRAANVVHQEFHDKMVSDVLRTLSDEEIESLIKGLKSLEKFFNKSRL